MNRVPVFVLACGLATGALASPLDEAVPFAMEEALQCSALLYHASTLSKDGSPLETDEPSQAAFFGYAMGAANLAKRAGKGPKFVDREVETRQAGVANMAAGERGTAVVKCVGDFDGYVKAAAAQ